MGIARVLEAVAKNGPMRLWLRDREEPDQIRVFWLVVSPTRYRHYTYSKDGLERAVVELDVTEMSKW